MPYFDTKQAASFSACVNRGVDEFHNIGLFGQLTVEFG